jgi:hypothetical protein
MDAEFVGAFFAPKATAAGKGHGRIVSREHEAGVTSVISAANKNLGCIAVPGLPL